ncbi:MAG TPA: FAD-dependent oxidoreductase [Dehalococcoidia bacterium]|nr:FAD-dependent oxidoreductase [Dehalococcoidia bacterium]
MARICILGGGICGLGTALLLARDGHDVTVVERDAGDVPGTIDEAWSAWERKGVAQFRQAHTLHPRVRHILEAELPDVLASLGEAGGLRTDTMSRLPPMVNDASPRDGDERFRGMTARRATVEAVFAQAARNEPRIEVMRGERVLGLATGADVVKGVPHVVGVETETRGTVRADLVIDATGRQSKLPDWIEAAGGRRPQEEIEAYQFAYYTRFFASRDGKLPQAIAPPLTEFATHSILSLPADNGHWSLTVYAANADQQAKQLRDAEKWTRVLEAHPLHKHWLDGEAITDVLPIAGAMDRQRRFVVDGAPVATGLLAVADAWASTNPSGGRGISIGLMHALKVRDVVREHIEAPERLALAFDEVTEREVAPYVRHQVMADRARIEAMDAAREGREPGGAAWEAAARWRMLSTAGPYDADAFRAFMDVAMCLALLDEVYERPGLAEQVAAIAQEKPPLALPCPTREELYALLA